MILLANKQNVTAPAGDFPFGNVNDNTGSNNGTPVNRAVMSDYFQFFEKMFDSSTVVANGLLDDDNNGFQLFDALISNVRLTTATTTLAGTVERATQTEVNSGTDTTRHLTPALIAGATDIITLAAMQDNSVDSGQYVNGSIDLIHMSVNSVDSPQYVDGSIDLIHMSVDSVDGTKIADESINSEHYVDGSIDLIHMSDNSVDSNQYVDGSIDDEHLSEARVKSVGSQILIKKIDIGDWNMDTTANVSITHSLTFDKIIAVTVMIRHDTLSSKFDINYSLDSTLSGGVSANSTDIFIFRVTSGFFDATTFDATSFNRGFITITYEA